MFPIILSGSLNLPVVFVYRFVREYKLLRSGFISMAAGISFTQDKAPRPQGSAHPCELVVIHRQLLGVNTRHEGMINRQDSQMYVIVCCLCRMYVDSVFTNCCWARQSSNVKSSEFLFFFFQVFYGICAITQKFSAILFMAALQANKCHSIPEACATVIQV